MDPKVSKGRSNSEAEVLKSELVGLFKHIQKIRTEIAMIKSPRADRFSTVTDELDLIIEATSSATDEIMNNVEKINDIAFILGDKLTADEDHALTNEIVDLVTNVIVACSFQDITGQRIQKIVKAIKYIEDHIDSLVSIWGQDAIFEQDIDVKEETDEYKKYLNGPQLKGQGVTQSQVDDLFGGGVSATTTVGSPPVVSQPNPPPVASAPPATAKVEASPKPKVEASPKPKVEEKKEPVSALDQSSIDALFG